MQILVTGGAGFIGGHLAESFIEAGHDVKVLDNLDPYYHVGIKKHTIDICRNTAARSTGSYTFIDGDIRDSQIVSGLVSDVDIVFHQAAQAGVRTSIDDPIKPNSVNVGGTLNVLDAARRSNVQRIVLASSSSVYGTKVYLPYDESHPTEPVSPYGVSKLAAEHYARVFNEVYDLPTVSLRYFTVYGPRMRPNMAISNFVSRCIGGNAPIVYGDGSQTRDFTYVDDIIRANETLLSSESADGHCVNIGSTDVITIRSLAQTIRDQLAPDLEIEYTEDRPVGDAAHTHADVSKAKTLIEYNPTVNIDEGIAKFIEWYRNNRDWYESLVLQS